MTYLFPACGMSGVDLNVFNVEERGIVRTGSIKDTQVAGAASGSRCTYAWTFPIRAWCSQPENANVLKCFLYHINEVVVTIGVRRAQIESGVNQIINRVISDPFHDLAILKFKSQPYGRQHGRAGVEMEGVVT